jgi:hypothetical protein
MQHVGFFVFGVGNVFQNAFYEGHQRLGFGEVELFHVDRSFLNLYNMKSERS